MKCEVCSTNIVDIEKAPYCKETKRFTCCKSCHDIEKHSYIATKPLKIDLNSNKL